MWKASAGHDIQPIKKVEPEDDDWETDLDFVNDVTEEEQRWGSRTVQGSGRTAGAIDMNKLREEVALAEATKQKNEVNVAAFGYGGKFGVQKDRMDQSAVGHDYIAKVEKHASQKDYSTGFGGKFGVQSDRTDKSAAGWDYVEAPHKHASQVDYRSGFGGKYGVQTDRQDKSAVGWDHVEKVPKHESQTDYAVGFGGKFGVQADRQDKSAVGWDHVEAVSKHESQVDHNKGFGGKFGIEKDRVDKSAYDFSEEPQPVGTQYKKEKPQIGSVKPSNLRAKFENLAKQGEEETRRKAEEERKKRKVQEEKEAKEAKEREDKRLREIKEKEVAAAKAAEIVKPPRVVKKQEETHLNDYLEKEDLVRLAPAQPPVVVAEHPANRLPESLTQSYRQPEPVTQPEPIRYPQPLKQTEPFKQPDTIPQPEPVGQIEQIIQPEPVKQTEQIMQPEPVKQTEQIRQPEPVKQTKQIRQPEPVKQTEQISQAVPVKQTEPLKQPEHFINPEPEPIEQTAPVVSPTYSEPQVEEQDIEGYELEETGYSAVALYDYQASASDEISFDPDDIITNIEMIDEGWWRGYCRGQYGLFPANYVILQ